MRWLWRKIRTWNQKYLLSKRPIVLGECSIHDVDSWVLFSLDDIEKALLVASPKKWDEVVAAHQLAGFSRIPNKPEDLLPLASVGQTQVDILRAILLGHDVRPYWIPVKREWRQLSNGR